MSITVLKKSITGTYFESV